MGLLRAAAGVVSVSLALAVAGCTIDGGSLPQSDEPTKTAVEDGQVPEMTAPPAVEQAQAAPVPLLATDVVPEQARRQLEEAVRTVISLYGGTAEIALSDGVTTTSIGQVDDEVSWSTIKVPLAIAALRRDGSQTTRNLVANTIQRSDNDTANQLWNSLGGGTQAAAAVDEVLVQGKVPAVHTSSVQSNPPYSPYGQTQFSVRDQAKFGVYLPCVPDSEYVVALMGKVINGAAYGLGTLPGVSFKGGWGPDRNGHYSARQFGFFMGPQGRVGVAIAAHPMAGTYPVAQAALTELAQAVGTVMQQARGMDPQQCGV